MALQSSNTTADLYHNPHAPPAAPDVAGVKLLLQGDFASAHAASIGGTTPWRWTHIALVDPSLDVRDAYTGGNTPTVGEGTTGSWQDVLYVPNKSETPFNVVFVERLGRGTPGDVKRVYLQRGAPAWPSSDV
jgi:hypothetical protein